MKIARFFVAQRLTLIVETRDGRRTVRDLRQIRREIGSLEENTNASAGSADRLASGISGTVLAFNQLTTAAQTLTSFLLPAFNALIGANEQLNQEILGTQSSLAATNNIFQDGFELTDPTQAIQALEQPVADALTKIREESLELVGVTSDQLVPLFNVSSG